MFDEKNTRIQDESQDSIKPTDELADEELEQVAGGDHSDFVIIKKIDKATPKLYETASTGRHE